MSKRFVWRAYAGDSGTWICDDLKTGNTLHVQRTETPHVWRILVAYVDMPRYRSETLRGAQIRAERYAIGCLKA